MVSNSSSYSYTIPVDVVVLAVTIERRRSVPTTSLFTSVLTETITVSLITLDFFLSVKPPQTNGLRPSSVNDITNRPILPVGTPELNVL